MKARDHCRHRRQAGFTLIELMIAITIMAIVAILSWRGLDQIVRGRQAVTVSMTSERVLSQAFDQMGIDIRAAAQDDDAGGGANGSAIQVGDSGVQILRRLDLPGQAPRLQLIRYRLLGGRLWRFASPPLATVGAVRTAMRAGGAPDGWSQVALIDGVMSLQSRGWIDEKGWTANDADLQDASDHAVGALRDPMTSGAPLFRTVRGIRVTARLGGLPQPYVRLYLVGE